eukprot:TRINITY_DN71027_c1_g1_i1.p1 TRINITY_DN71027_c1_g1~~TRINITY_DN71027_c1_g1_i1.p1  ORF type:complete len:711 (+),score=61.82 TRINITY_DN71027_c1_g1_i1:3412-5544(+)
MLIMKKIGRSSAIGIDFGTSKTTLSVWSNGHTDIILNAEEERSTPSCVCYTDEERLIGATAASRIGKFPWNSISSFKRLLGTNFYDPTIEKMSKTLPYKIEPGPNSQPLVAVDYHGVKKFTPEQITSTLLARLKAQASEYLGHEVKYAVLSVPCTFSRSQVEALKHAALISGLYALTTVTEGALAGAEYAFKNIEGADPKLVLFFNMGGGYLDLSLCNIQSASCFVISTEGREIGGNDMDDALVSHCIQEYFKKTGVALGKNYRALRKLKADCEKAKKSLSLLNEVVIDIPSIINDDDFTLKITREKFEEINTGVFEQCREVLAKLLEKTNLAKDDIQEIVLLGGGTRVPKIKQLVRAFFGRDPQHNINADEAVANGAAIHAALLSNELYYHGTSLSDKILLNDVLTFTLGVQTKPHEFIPVLTQNTPIPAKNTVKLKLDLASKTAAINVVESGIKKTSVLDSIAAPLATELELTIEIDQMNIISALLAYVDENHKKVNRGCVVNCKNKLTVEEIETISKEEEKYTREDYEHIRAKETRNELEKYCNILSNKLEEKGFRSYIPEKARTFLGLLVNHTLSWLEGNQKLSSAECIGKRKQLEEAFDAIQRKEYGKLEQVVGIPEEIKKAIPFIKQCFHNLFHTFKNNMFNGRQRIHSLIGLTKRNKRGFFWKFVFDHFIDSVLFLFVIILRRRTKKESNSKNPFAPKISSAR